MNRRWILPLVLLVAIISANCTKVNENNNALYVSVDGDDNNPGTLEKPLASLQAAIDKTPGLLKDAEGDIHIYLRGGTYRVNESIVIDSTIRASEGTHLIISNYENEKVYLNGGVVIPDEKTHNCEDEQVLARLPKEAHGKVLEADLAGLGIASYGRQWQHGFSYPVRETRAELFARGKRMQLARWPNDSIVKIGKVHDPGTNPSKAEKTPRYTGEVDSFYRGATFEYDYNRAERWAQAEDIWLGGVFAYGYADGYLQVKNIDNENKTITTKQPYFYSFYSSDDELYGKHSRGYYVYNLLEEIDMPGEYYIDKANNKAYFIPPEGEGKNEYMISLLKDPILCIEGSEFVEINGLTIENGRDQAIYMERGDNNKITNCTIRHMGTCGIQMGQGTVPDSASSYDKPFEPAPREIGNMLNYEYYNNVWNKHAGTNHSISGCELYDLGTGGIILDGGDRKTLKPGKNEVVDCDLYDFNRVNRTYYPAIRISGVANRIAHCYIHDAAHMVIYLHGNEHMIEYNEITRVCQWASDMGAIYSGRNPSERGNVIRHNYFHHFEDSLNWVTAIYLDDSESDYHIYGNVFYKVGSPLFGAVYFHAGYDNVVENNIFVDCYYASWINMWDYAYWFNWLDWPLIQKRLFEEINIKEPPYSERYPKLTDIMTDTARENYFRKNLMVNCRKSYDEDYTAEHNISTTEDPGFVDYAGGNFSLKEKAWAFDSIPGFEAVPFAKMGLKE